MNILIASPIFSEAIDRLRSEHDVICAFGAPVPELKEKIVDRDILVFRSGVDINAEVLASAPRLGLVIRAGSGIDNIDLDYVKRHGLKLKRIEGPGAKAVAELGFAMMLNLARQVRRADALLRQGHWAKHEITGHLLTGKTLGVYGAGNIGMRVARMGVAWGMTALGCVANPSAERAEEMRGDGVELVAPDELLARSDYVSINVPLNQSTRDLFDAETFSRMKKGAYLVNLSRGGVVREADLLDALESGHLAGAGTDVHEREGEGKVSPLAHLDNVILTPHMGAGTVDSQREIGEIVLATVAAHAKSGNDD